MNTNARNVTEINKQKMIQSLLMLLNTKDFNQITINEISREAQVSKRTFYRAFNSKEAVLANYGLDSFNQYIATIKQIEQPDFFKIIQGLFEFWYQRRKIVKTLIDQHLFNLVFEQVQGELVSNYLSLSFSWHQVTNDNEIRLLMQFMLGGITEIIQDWLRVPSPESPVAITEKFQKIIRDIQILPN